MGTKKTLALDGIVVADFSHALSAPYGCMMLADAGADLIKIESPNPDVFRILNKGAYAAVVHRNKRALSLDLKKDEAKKIAWKIIEKADVLIENFTPGAFERLGFGYEDVKKINPGIIYCSLSGFGQTGPYKNLGGYDVVAQAMSGIMEATGDQDRLPVRIGPSIVDMGSGMYLAIGVLQAILERQKTGEGQRIDISLLETALSWMSPFVALCSMTGEVPKRWGSGFAPFCPYRVYNSSDGTVFIGVSTNHFWKRFCDAFDLKELSAMKKFEDISGRVGNRDELDGLVQDVMVKLKTDDILAKLREAAIPCAPVYSVEDAMNDPHVKERGCLVEQDHPACGKMTFVKNPIRSNGEFPEIRFPSPAQGEQTVEILGELGYSAKEIEEFIAAKVALPPKK